MQRPMVFTLQQLVAELGAAVKATQGLVRCEPDAGLQQVQIDSADGRSATVGLLALFERVRMLPASGRREVIERWVRLALGTSRPNWEVARLQLRPALRKLHRAGTAHRNLCRGCELPFLGEYLVLERPDALAFVNECHLEHWGVSVDEAYEAGRRNIKPTSPIVDDDLWVYEGYDCPSLLLRPGWLAGLADRVGSDPIAAVPGHGVLVVGASSVVRDLLTRALAFYRSEPDALSPSVYAVDGQKVVPLELPSGHSMRAAVEAGHRELLATVYARQTAALRAGDAQCFVADLVVVRDGERNDRTLCEVSIDMDGLYPQTDLVRLSYGGVGAPHLGGALTVPWASLREIVPGCLEPVPGFSPPRFRRRAWPTSPQMAELEQCRVEVELAHVGRTSVRRGPVPC